MAYDLRLADRIRAALENKRIRFNDKEMFGGIAFMVREKMCVGIIKDDMMVRIDPELAEQVLSKPGVRPMDFSGRPMKGYYYVSPEAVTSSAKLNYWIDLCLEFNPKAATRKKKRR